LSVLARANWTEMPPRWRRKSHQDDVEKAYLGTKK